MSEIIPRWGMPEVDFLETDPEKILESIISLYEEKTGRTLAQADPVRLFLNTIAAVIIQLRQEINRAGQQNLLTYAQGDKLDALGIWVDVARLPASKAVTTLEFKLSKPLANAYVIAEGFEVSNGELVFSTNRELVIDPGEETGTVDASCSLAGVTGNGVLPDEITTIIKPQAFLESVRNLTETSGGADEEEDPEYAERIRLRVDGYSVAGPRLAYIYFAKSYSSAITDVAVFSPVPGQVDVYCLLENGTLPNESFLDGLTEFLSADSIRPLTDYVVCKAPEPVPFSIHVDYWINKEDRENSAAIREAVESAVEEYQLWQQGRIGRDITPSQLITKIGLAGASRINEATFEPKTFKELKINQIGQCSGITVNFMGYKDI